MSKQALTLQFILLYHKTSILQKPKQGKHNWFY